MKGMLKLKKLKNIVKKKNSFFMKFQLKQIKILI